MATKILAISIKVINAKSSDEAGYHEINIDFDQVSLLHGKNEITGKMSISDAVLLFWWKSLPLLLETKLALFKDEKFYIKAAPFIKWVDIVISKRTLIGSLGIDEEMEKKLIADLNIIEIGRKYEIHDDFRPKMNIA